MTRGGLAIELHVSARLVSRGLPVRVGSRQDRDEATQGRMMDKAEIEMLARRAGLEKALTEHPEDVAAAANQAAGVVARMQAPTDPKAEPWPPMKAGTGL
jgi:hypothetical protein